MMYKLMFLILLVLFFVGCSSSKGIKVDQEQQRHILGVARYDSLDIDCKWTLSNNGLDTLNMGVIGFDGYFESISPDLSDTLKVQYYRHSLNYDWENTDIKILPDSQYTFRYLIPYEFRQKHGPATYQVKHVFPLLNAETEVCHFPFDPNYFIRRN